MLAQRPQMIFDSGQLVVKLVQLSHYFPAEILDKLVDAAAEVCLIAA